MNHNEKITCTALFLRPMLEIPNKDLEENNFINAYLDDVSHDIHYDECIYILFKPSDIDKFQYFLSKERERITIVEDYDYEEYVVVIYQLPEKFKDDYQLFLEGKYSKFSEDLKDVFLRISGRDCLQLQIVTKAPDLKKLWEDEFEVTIGNDQEIWERPDLYKEVLDIEEVIKQKVK